MSWHWHSPMTNWGPGMRLLMNMNEAQVKMVVFPPYIFDLCFNAKQSSLALGTLTPFLPNA